MKIGVLALQGAVQPHRPHIEAAGAEFEAVKTPAQFDGVDAFILPGGESTTMLKLIETFGLWESLKRNFAAKPVWGVCAGCILMAEHVRYAEPRAKDNTRSIQKSFSLLPMTVERNAYGTQIQSHHSQIDNYPVSFIRAPKIRLLDKSVDVLSSHEETPAWVSKGQYMATTFHPELTLDFPSPMHRYFIEKIANP